MPIADRSENVHVLFISSGGPDRPPQRWFAKLKERCVWRHELETLDQAREVIAACIDHYHDRPHSSLGYRTPREVRATWTMRQDN